MMATVAHEMQQRATEKKNVRERLPRVFRVVSQKEPEADESEGHEDPEHRGAHHGGAVFMRMMVGHAAEATPGS